jgi:hypothetical protein
MQCDNAISNGTIESLFLCVILFFFFFDVESLLLIFLKANKKREKLEQR